MPAEPRTIDLAPTWTAVMPILFETLLNGSPTGKQMAKEELLRLAKWADETMAEAKEKARG